jgi:hypothetical protein
MNEDLSDLSMIKNDGPFGIGFKFTEERWFVWRKYEQKVLYTRLSAKFTNEVFNPTTDKSIEDFLLSFAKEYFPELPEAGFLETTTPI